MTGAWANSTGRTRTRTPQWRRLRRLVLHRDHGICHICGQPGATDVDHITPHAEGGTDDPTNLAPIHPIPCHRDKTAREAARGRSRYPRMSVNRKAEKHPGLKGGGGPAPRVREGR